MERLSDASQAMVTGADPKLEIELLVADLTLKAREAAMNNGAEIRAQRPVLPGGCICT